MQRRNLIRQELEQIARKKGTLNPHDVVNFARNSRTALHKCFIWDDSKAAEQWRLHQARNIIRLIVEIPMNGNDKEYKVFVSLRDDRQNKIGYRPLISVMTNDELREKLLEDALADMQTFRDKYKELKELSETFAAMERDKAKIISKRGRSSLSRKMEAYA